MFGRGREKMHKLAMCLTSVYINCCHVPRKTRDLGNSLNLCCMKDRAHDTSLSPFVSIDSALELV